MWKKNIIKLKGGVLFGATVRHYSRIAPPPPAVIRVSNNVAKLGCPKDGPKPCQMMSLPPFPSHPLPGRKSVRHHVTAVSWLKYYFDDISDSVIQSHFNKGLVSYPFIMFFSSSSYSLQGNDGHSVFGVELLSFGSLFFWSVF